MGKKNREKRRGYSHRQRKRLIWGIIALIAAAVYILIYHRPAPNYDISQNASGSLKVHFLDVGQADCILIQSDGKNMLIDAGNNNDKEYVISYLREQGVTRLDYAIGTHAHEDHIGSMDDVILNFEIGELFLPDQTYETQSYTDVLIAAENRELHVTHPKFKETRYLGEARFIFVMPDADREYTDLNDSSLGIRISNGKHSFLLCGDSSKAMEEEFLDSRIYLHSDVFKVSHHGSSDANSTAFLKAVDPEYAVISCGKNNDYGHPHKRTLKRLKKTGAKLFRTDQQGTIIFESDGNILTCNTNAL